MRALFNTSQVQHLQHLYSLGNSTRTIGNLYGTSGTTIHRVLRRAGVICRPLTESNRTLPLNTSAFAVLTEESKYWIGMLMADGDVSDRGRVQLGLAELDRSHLERFQSFLGADRHAFYICHRDSGDILTLTVWSVDLVHQLASYGVGPRKSFTARASDELAKDKHFWRGVVDGDGCIGVGPKGYVVLEVVGSYSTLEQYVTFINSQCIANKPFRGKICKHGSVFRVRTCASKAKAILKVLYEGCSVALTRKHGLATDVLENTNDSGRY